MFKTTAIDTLKQDKKCQACWYIILSTMSGSTTTRPRNLKAKTESRARKEIEKGKLSTINEQSPIQVLRKNIAHKNNH